MKYAFYPGCVARGAAPELYKSTMMVVDKLGIELEEIEKAACTGAGVLQEKNQKLGDVLNISSNSLSKAGVYSTKSLSLNGIESTLSNFLGNNTRFVFSPKE